ncbi:MAG TPA: LPS export ABC transporter periplasmic protein LptC [Longimicrobiales bacterium]|nr:LPS export ABC transporter periplasmic protein LptC [Longimicrobiales bacterium]
MRPARWILAAALLTATACGREEGPVSGRDFQDLPADQVMFDAGHDIRDMGTLRARLHADTAYVFEDSARTLWRPVDLKLYDADGAQTAHLTSLEGTLDMRTNRMVARGSVVLVTTEGHRRILTEELHYDPSTGRIWSDVPTVVFEDETRLEGQGFSSDEDMRNIEVFKGTGENIRIEF